MIALTECLHHLMVPQQGNAMAAMPASLIASLWSLLILRNGDATTIPRSFPFVWVSLPRTTAKLNFSQNPWEEPPQHPFAPVNPKQPGATLLVFAWKLCQTVVKHAFHSLHSDTKDNYGQHGQHKLVVWLHPKFTSRRRFQSILQTLLLGWREHDESLTWWQVNPRSANSNMLFLGKASFSCSQKMSTDRLFSSSPTLPPCTGGQ